MADEQNPFAHLNAPAQPAPVQAQPTDRGVVIVNPAVREQERAEESQAMEAERLRLSQAGELRSGREETRTTAENLRREYRGLPAVEDYENAITNYAAGLRTAPNGSGDLALVYNFAKIVDPGAAVQQGDMENIQSTDARLPAAAQNALRQLRLSDGVFTDEAREGLRREMHNIISQRNLAYRAARDQYRQIALSPEYGVDPDLVIGQHSGTPFREQISEYWAAQQAAQEPQATTAAEYGAGGEGPALGIVSEQESADYWGGEPAFNSAGQPVGAGYNGPLFDRAGNRMGTVVTVTAGDVREEMSLPESILETITGSERSTPEIEALPDWTDMPVTEGIFDDPGKMLQVAAATMMSSPAETAQIIQSQFPGVRVRQDAAGNYILRSPIDGQEYAIKPGFRASDIPRAAGAVLAFTPAGRATTVPGAFMAEAATQAGMEALQAGTGGTFNPEEVLMAGVGGAALPAAGTVIRTIREARAARQAVPEVPPVGGAVPEMPPSPPAGAAPPPAGGAAPEVSAPTPTPPRAPSVAEQQGISEEMVSLARRAAGRGPGSSAARAELRAAVEADPALIQQAETLGLELPADVFSANQQLKNLIGLARSQPGSAAEAGWQQTVTNSAQQVEQSLTEMGASRDLAGLSDEVFTRLNSNMESLQRQGDELREAVNANLNMQSRVEATNLQDALAQTINDLGGIEEATQAMTSQERRLLQALGVGETPKQPTYAYMDRLRREIGDALNTGTGPWADTERVTLQRYYNALADDRIAHVARELGQDAADDLAASNQIFQAMYAARDEMTNLFGRDLDKGIGAQIRSVIAQGARGDTTNLRRLMAVIPEDMRADVAFSGILANARSRGAEGGFSFLNFRNTYRAIRENAPVYRELARNMTESQRTFLDNLYAVSGGIADAQRRIIPTGRARGGPAAEINAQSLTQKIVEQATRRGVGAASGMGGTLIAGGDLMIGLPLAAAMESAMAYLGRSGASNLDRVSDVIGSAAYRDLVNEAGRGGNMTRAINRLANSRPFGLFARSLGLDTQDARRAWIRSALAVATVAAPEQSEPIKVRPPAGAITVKPQQ